MTSHWPTFADGLFWCACDNRTFDTEEAWLAHVVDSVLRERSRASCDAMWAFNAPGTTDYICGTCGQEFSGRSWPIPHDKPSESADRNPQPGR